MECRTEYAAYVCVLPTRGQPHVLSSGNLIIQIIHFPTPSLLPFVGICGWFMGWILWSAWMRFSLCCTILHYVFHGTETKKWYGIQFLSVIYWVYSALSHFPKVLIPFSLWKYANVYFYYLYLNSYDGFRMVCGFFFPTTSLLWPPKGLLKGLSN